MYGEKALINTTVFVIKEWQLAKSLSMALLCVAFSASCAANDALSIDQTPIHTMDLAFPNENNVQPSLGDFGIKNHVLMSNDEGERWAVVTIENEASGRRTLTNKHLLAILANGERIHPNDFSESFDGKEMKSVTMSFGYSKFPILSIYSRTDI